MWSFKEINGHINYFIMWSFTKLNGHIEFYIKKKKF